MAIAPSTVCVLVVDGPRHLPAPLRERLAASGAQVLAFAELDAALDHLVRRPVDAVVLDLLDPHEAVDVVGRLVAAAPGADVVVVGPAEDDGAAAEVRRAGALEFVGDGGGDDPAAEVAFVVQTALGRRRGVAAGAPPEAVLEQVRSWHRRQRTLVTLAPVGIIETDASGACTYVNPRWSELTGLAPRQAWGDGWTTALHADDRERVFAAWVRAVAAGRELQLEHRLARPAGGERWASMASVPLLDADGTVVGHLATVTDVTDLKAAQQASEDARSKLAAMVEHWPGAASLQDVDGRFLMANRHAVALTQAPEGRLVGRLPEEVLTPGQVAAARERDRRVLAGEVVAFEPILESPEGPRSLLTTKFPVRDADGEIVAMGGLSIDITERQAVQQALRDAEERFRHAFEDAPIGMALADLEGRFAQVNQALCELTGYSPDLLLRTTWQSLVHPDDAGEDEAAVVALLGSRLRVHHRELRLLHATGEPVWVAVHLTLVRAADGTPRHLLAQVQDVTDRKRFEGRLQHMADHDPLTGLLNRRRFEEELDRQVAMVQRYGPRGALLVLDLDHFKVVNDTLGHNAGDELIVSVADVLRRRLRETDHIARLGGDEFAVLLPEVDTADAERVAHDLVEEIRRHAAVLNGDRPRRVTASLGIALFEDGLQAGEEVLVNADLAMYDAKEAGRDGVALFASDRYAEPRMKARVAWVERIRSALEDDLFVLEAQPIRDLRTGETVQCELLLRMLDESGDTIPPGAFLYVAERYDLIQRIDRWVAMRAIELLGRHPEMTFEVNVSGKSLNDPALLEAVEQGLRDSGADPRRLVFEVTETAAVANIHQAREFAERLARLGCRFALDDFGAGFGSFYYLKHLPFDYLKIDGEFISNCLSSRTDQLVIEAVVNIARGLGKATIAEFVGDEATERFLRGHGVDLAQGFFVGPPVPVDELVRRRR